MSLRVPLEVDGWYHCYTRGVEKRRTFQSAADYQRFLETLYVCNSDEALQRSNLSTTVFTKSRGKPLVSIAAYCLMPNHFHLLMQEITENGISRFMQKVGTAYAMYFNIKNERVGGLFVKPFRSRFVGDDRYLRRVAQYIHLNPAELFEREWKRGNVSDLRMLEKKMREYHYSSLPDYLGVSRPESSILDRAAREVISDALPHFSEVLVDAKEYYEQLGI